MDEIVKELTLELSHLLGRAKNIEKRILHRIEAIKPNIEDIAPKELTDIDLSFVMEACREYMEYLKSEDFHFDGKDDYEEAIEEAAMMAMYGEDVYEFINQRVEDSGG